MKKISYIEYLKSIVGNDIKYQNIQVKTEDALDKEIYFFQRLLNGFNKHYLSEEGFYLKYKPTIDQNISQLKIALSLQGLTFSENIIESIVETYNLILKKGGETSMKDCFDVKKKVNKKYNQYYTTYNYELNK
jgi:hypothetical protein